MSALFFLIFISLFVIFLFGVFTIAEGQRNPIPRMKMRNWGRSPVRDKMTHAAAIAMRRAGYDGGEDYVRAVDIGLLAYRHSEEPKLVRNGEVLLDTLFLRPFAELWLPYPARGTVRFDLLDGEGRLRYADETEYDLAQGKNTLLPSTWLPLQGKLIQPDEQWQLRLLAGETLLSVHVFGWEEVGGGEIQRYVDGDGEISPELQRALQARSREAVSLSELLADQEDWA